VLLGAAAILSVNPARITSSEISVNSAVSQRISLLNLGLGDGYLLGFRLLMDTFKDSENSDAGANVGLMMGRIFSSRSSDSWRDRSTNR